MSRLINSVTHGSVDERMIGSVTSSLVRDEVRETTFWLTPRKILQSMLDDEVSGLNVC